jgi:thiamine biosynthesis lipoprotein
LIAPRVSLALEAMATRFELLLWGRDEGTLRAAGEEALAEIAWADAELSRYRPGSAVFWLNASAGGRPLHLDARVLALLEQSRRLSAATLGAFDPTVGPLLRAWGFVGGRGHMAESARLAAARLLVGMEHLELDLAAGTARLAAPGMELDLGAIGKGFALDRAMAVLEEHEVERVLLHGGTSSVHVLGPGPDGGPWRMGWRVPGRSPEVEVVELLAPAFSVSAPHGRSFVHEGRVLGHVLDPRIGLPVEGALSAAVGGASSTVCDALSTALLVLGEAGLPRLRSLFPGASLRLARTAESARDVRDRIDPCPSQKLRPRAYARSRSAS